MMSLQKRHTVRVNGKKAVHLHVVVEQDLRFLTGTEILRERERERGIGKAEWILEGFQRIWEERKATERIKSATGSHRCVAW